MKFAKLSLAAVAAMGITSGAMALDLSKATIKPYVNTKLYYETQKTKGSDEKLFDHAANSSGQALLQVGATGKLNGCWGYGLEYSVADTLGLENNLVGATRMGTDRMGDPLATQDWMSQAYVTFRGCGTPLDKTTFKIGRQYLDTPLAFTETWNLAPNSFDAIVAMNQDIDNVTLVGAYVGKHNSTFGRVTNGDNFQTFGSKGAYVLGALTNFGVPVNLWYYNVNGVAKAYWADTNINIVDMAKLGLQYGTVNADKAGKDTTRGGAISLSGNVAGFDLMAAYSKVNSGNGIALANVATDGKKTKLATAGIYTDGVYVAQPDSKAWKVKAATNTPIGKVALQVIKNKNDSNAALEQTETDLILGTKILGINTKLIGINENKKNAANVQHVRIIMSKNF